MRDFGQSQQHSGYFKGNSKGNPIKLSLEDDAIDFIVDMAFENKLGARGLRGICELILQDFMFEAPSQKGKSELIITKAIAEKKWNRADSQKFAS